MIAENISINAQGHLTFAGRDTVELAEKYGTALYLMDENCIRKKCQVYLQAMREAFGPAALPLYASKAAAFRHIYRVIQEEGLGIDVVSPGEIYTAAKAGFDLGLAYYHNNSKSDRDVAFAMEYGVGCFVADNLEELNAIEAEAARRGLRQKVLLRVTPGIDPHTYEAINTGKVDSKFGVAIETGQAAPMIQYAMTLPHVDLAGLHCHVGSQVFEEDVFERTLDIMVPFMAQLKQDYGFETRELDLGGGYGVRYVEEDPVVDLGQRIRCVGVHMRKILEAYGLPMPAMRMEPGRSIVADAGMTLYTVQTVKKITGYKNYVSVDGGMTDNPRYALYGAKYTVFVANRATAAQDLTCDVVGYCCESDDVIQPAVCLPEPVRGDVLAVCTTGAYNYSMASNYNRMMRPALVMLYNGQDTLAVRRESLDDLIANDL